MQIISFPAHYQSVYTNFDISSFSLISCSVISVKLHSKVGQVTAGFNRDCQIIGYILFYRLPIYYMITMDVMSCDECHAGLSQLSFLWMTMEVMLYYEAFFL